MLKEVPADIQRIIYALLIQRLDVTGTTMSDGRTLYSVNGHSFTEDELRALSQKQSDILSHTGSRPAREACCSGGSGKTETYTQTQGSNRWTLTKLRWCKRFHRTWRRRVAILPSVESMLRYEVRCLKCDVSDVEVTEFEKTKAASS
jgi:hypothetical protein